MVETRSRAEKRLTRALAWERLLLDARERWSEVWSAWRPERAMVLALLDQALADNDDEIAIARAEAE